MLSFMSAGGVHSTRLQGVNAAGLQIVAMTPGCILLMACMLAYSWRQSTSYSTYLYRMLMRPTIMGAICVDVSHEFKTGPRVRQQNAELL